MHTLRFTTIVGLFACALGAWPSGEGVPSRRDADVLKLKLASILDFPLQRSPRVRRTPITDREMNAYLFYEGPGQLPAGVVEPSVTILGGNRLSGRAIVDLDAVRRQKNPTSLLDPMYYLSGRLPVTATGSLRTSSGVARFSLESATVGTLSIPKVVLQEIVSYYSRTPDRPAGMSLDENFQLPAQIREIQIVQRGEAIVVQ